MKEPWLFLGTLPAPVSSSVDGRHRVMGSEQEVMCEHPHAATVEERLCRRPRVGGQAADAEKEFGLEQGEDHVAELVHGHGLKMFVDLKQGETLPIHINISVPSLLCEDLDDTLYLLRPRISCHARRTLSLMQGMSGLMQQLAKNCKDVP